MYCKCSISVLYCLSARVFIMTCITINRIKPPSMIIEKSGDGPGAACNSTSSKSVDEAAGLSIPPAGAADFLGVISLSLAAGSFLSDALSDVLSLSNALSLSDVLASSDFFSEASFFSDLSAGLSLDAL